MKKILYTWGLFCSIFFAACNESTEIVIPEALPTVEDDGGDITFTPEDLKLPGKKGVCLKLGADVREKNIAKIKELGALWNYSWGWEFVDGQPQGVEFIPMFWGKGSVASNTLSYLKEQIVNGSCKRVLGFNEPDGEKQANMTVEQALELWPQLQSLKVPLGSPAVTDNKDGKDWLASFMQGVEERGYRVDFICIHNYGGPNATSFKNDINYFIDTYQLPVLITEFAVADWGAQTIADNKYTPEQVLAFMKEVLPWLEQNENVLGYAWFQSGIDSPVGWPGALYDTDGQLTACGEYYRDLQPGGEGGEEGDGSDGGDDDNPSLDPGNLVQNPGFEDGLPANSNGVGGWLVNNETKIEANIDYVISGEKSLRLTTVKQAKSTQQIITVTPGRKYKLGLTGRVQDAAGAAGSSANTNHALQMIIREPNNNNNIYSSIETKSNTDEHIKGELTIDDGVSQIEIMIYKTSGIAYIDDVYFIEVAE